MGDKVAETDLPVVVSTVAKKDIDHSNVQNRRKPVVVVAPVANDPVRDPTEMRRES